MPDMRRLDFLIYADGAIFGAPVHSLEQAKEQAFKLIQKHQRVHIESTSRLSKRYWRYEPRAHAWVQMALGDEAPRGRFSEE